MKNIAVIGYGVIGKKVADAINVQDIGICIESGRRSCIYEFEYNNSSHKRTIVEKKNRQ